MRECCGAPARGEFYLWGKQRRRRSGAGVPGPPGCDRVVPVPPARDGAGPCPPSPAAAPRRREQRAAGREAGRERRRAGRRRQGQRGGGGGEAGTQQEPSRHTHRRTPRKLAAASGETGLRWPPPQGAHRRPAGARCLPGPFAPYHRPSLHSISHGRRGAGTAWHGALPAAGLEPVVRGVSPHRRGGWLSLPVPPSAGLGRRTALTERPGLLLPVRAAPAERSPPRGRGRRSGRGQEVEKGGEESAV